MKDNIITLSDSYKYSHPWQYPQDMTGMFDYAEARSGSTYPATLFFGLQYLIKRYLSTPITNEDISEAKEMAMAHGIPFDLKGWQYILYKHNGYLPVEIRAVTEGLVIPTGNVLFTIKSTDAQVPWVVGFLETLLMKVWYTSNIATRSYYVREMLEEYYNMTCDMLDGLDFSFHNFGDRGSSSPESAGIGGVAHLTQFLGSDNFNSLKYAREYYGTFPAGFSIPATEHSTTTSWSKNNELDMIMAHLEFNRDRDVIAAVCDSYDYYKTVHALTSRDYVFKEKIESDSYPKFIIRPDSGDPLEVIERTLDIMEENEVVYTTNKKGYKVFTKYGIIWGDGIDMHTMKRILKMLTKRGYATSNIAFGSGGWLMQQHDRDTQGWAVKCSQVTIDDNKRDVYKDPITGKAKKSKKGELTLWYNHATNKYFTDTVDFKTNDAPVSNMLHTVYRDGTLTRQQTLEEVRDASRTN